MFTARRWSGWPLFLVALASCARVDVPATQSLLARPVMNPDSVSFDIYTVRFPAENDDVEEMLWAQIDEQSLPTATRRSLAAFGLRAGTVDGQIPRALSQLIRERSPDLEAADQWLSNLQQQPAVQRRHVQAPAGQAIRVVESGIAPQVSILRREGDSVVGETYRNAQAMFELKAVAQPDGRVKLSLVPELHHGIATTKYVARNGATVCVTAKPRIVYEQLRIEAALSPGEMIIVGDRADKSAALGNLFFVEAESSPPSRKLLVIRLAQTQHDGLVSSGFGSEPPVDDTFLVDAPRTEP